MLEIWFLFFKRGFPAILSLYFNRCAFLQCYHVMSNHVIQTLSSRVKQTAAPSAAQETRCAAATSGTNQKRSWTLRGKEKGWEKATRQELPHLPSTQPNNALHSLPSSAVEGGAPVASPTCSCSGLSPSHPLQGSVPAMNPSLNHKFPVFRWTIPLIPQDPPTINKPINPSLAMSPPSTHHLPLCSSS